MKTIATFDIGTTAVKAVLMGADGHPIRVESAELETFRRGPGGSHLEQSPRQWYEAFCAISRRFAQACAPGELAGIVLSGQMQDLILLDEAGEPVMDAILYSDGRAEAEAEELAGLLGRGALEHATANHFDGSRPFAKLLWVQRHRPEAYRRAAHALVSAKDYAVAKLTGAYITDVTSASTAGLMDIQAKGWREDWLARAGLDQVSWARLCHAHERVGAVGEKAARETGYPVGTPVYAGAGDAGATTLASGIARDGEFNINLGTSGWVACTSDAPLRRDGVSNLAAMPENVYINVVPFFNAGNVHRWAADLLCGEEAPEARYGRFEALAASAQPSEGGLLFLPYLGGERFPVMDAEVAGCFVGVRPGTGRAQMARAALEGVAYSIRQGVEAIGKKPVSCSLVGGGARSGLWCQILADMLRLPIQVYRDATYLPSMALAASVLIGRGELAGYDAFTGAFQRVDTRVTYQPEEAAAAVYDRHYRRFAGIYPAVKSLPEVEA